MLNIKEFTILAIFCCLGLSAVTTSVYAKDNWDKWMLYENGYFRMYTDASEKKAMRLLEELEKFRLLAQTGLTVKIPADAPKTLVLLFKSRGKFSKYRYRNSVAGYVMTLENVPVIVMPASSRGLDSETVIKHEYVHAVQAYDKYKSPRWVREGVAEMFSTATYHKNFALVGALNEDRWQYLYREINYDKLIQDDFDSLKRRMGVDAYAQYWLLVNYSFTHDDGKYQTNIGEYLRRYRAGEDTLEAFRQAYGRSPDEFAAEAMSNYRKRSYSYNQLIFLIKPEEMDLQVIPRKPDEGLVERLMLGVRSRIDEYKKP